MPPAFVALPPESPLAMPVQDLRRRPSEAPRERPSAPPGMAWRRVLVLGGAVALTVLAAREMHKVLGVSGLTPLEILILVVFVLLFAWIALSLISSLAGFVALLRRGAHRLDAPADPAVLPRCALLMPAYNEAPGRIMAALASLHGELAAAGAGERFDLFVLSDTTDPDAWIAEEAAFLRLRDLLGPDSRVFYRRRAKNTERKAGNIGDWVRRWGGAYECFLILDADSVMTADCVLRLAGAVSRFPDVGLVQSLPVIVGGRTLFARTQQFAGRVYGPMIAAGIAWWHGADGNYWGHNAMIRTRAFAEAAGLPTLPGRKPFGGHVLSHDFVEAALLRRAGWAVHMMPALPGSFEECPPSLMDLAVRDRRWCQGNLQHVAVLPARGLHPVSRLHLLMGIGSYVTAPLWLLFLLVGIAVSLQARFTPPDYFPAGPSLFPVWPAVDPVRSMWVFIGTMGALLGPKLLAWFVAVLRDRRGFGGVVRSLLGVVLESLVSGLLAPVTMLTQTGSVLTILAGIDGGWAPQRREGGGVPFWSTARRFLSHTLLGVGLALASWAVSVPLLLWMSPVVLGLLLAAPLAWLTARTDAGLLLARLGLLRIPEEVAPPPALAAVNRLAPLLAPDAEGTEAFARLRADPALLAAHRAMLPPPRAPGEPFDPALLLGLAKLDEAATLAAAALGRPERAAVLGHAEGLRRALDLPP